MNPKRKIEHVTFTGIIHCLSGLHIGGSDDLLQIGGTDLTCIKHPVTLEPYIPGTSLKGRLRSELEKRDGWFSRNGTEPCSCGAETCLVCRVFGPHKNPKHNLGPTRIIVRDARLVSGGELELKPENAINRLTGTAKDPRKVERVAAGAEFSLNIGLQIWDVDNREQLIEFIKGGLRLLQQTGIGAGVSKGSGEIELRQLALNGKPFDLGVAS